MNELQRPTPDFTSAVPCCCCCQCVRVCGLILTCIPATLFLLRLSVSSVDEPEGRNRGWERSGSIALALEARSSSIGRNQSTGSHSQTSSSRMHVWRPTTTYLFKYTKRPVEYVGWLGRDATKTMNESWNILESRLFIHESQPSPYRER